MALVQRVDIAQKDQVVLRPAVALDGGGASYTATYWMDDVSAPFASIVLPRETVEAAVFCNACVSLELRTDGTLAAFASHASMQTLASLSLTELIAETLRPDLAALEDTPNALAKLETELEQALASVRMFRAQRGIG